MSNQIKLDVETLKNELENYSNAIESFKGYNKKFIENTIEKVGMSNSDFIEQIKETLDFMKDTKSKDLVKKLERVKDLSNIIITEFENSDNKIANSTKNRGSF